MTPIVHPKPPAAAITLAPAGFLLLTLVLPAAIVAGNFAIGSQTPITIWLEDDVSYIDAVWHLAQGRRLGSDFHYVLGFGVLEGAALLWRWIGPSYGVLRGSADLFALVMVACAAIVAHRQLRHLPLVATLFCVAVAVEATAPSLYGATREFGMNGFYNRLITAGLVVLFVQSFARQGGPAGRRDPVGPLVAALLLNLLFLTKISGLVLGLVVVVAGAVLGGDDRVRRLRDLAVVMLLLAIMIAIDFAVSGADLGAVLRSYWHAAQGRSPDVNPQALLVLMTGWPILAACLMLALYAALHAAPGGARARCLAIIAVCWLVQFVLNMSNNAVAPESVAYLAPAAAAAIASWTGVGGVTAVRPRRIGPRRLFDLLMGRAIPALVVALVLVPDLVGTLRAARFAYWTETGRLPTLAMTAGRGVSFVVLANRDRDQFIEMVRAVNGAVATIERLGLAKSTIANLDVANPFPVLFGAPSPRGVAVAWDFADLPAGYSPTLKELVGDACLVVEPRKTVMEAGYLERLTASARASLIAAFTPVHDDAAWRLWKRKDGC